jgi:5-methylcytosine-specific restriction endonuclease McrA
MIKFTDELVARPVEFRDGRPFQLPSRRVARVLNGRERRKEYQRYMQSVHWYGLRKQLFQIQGHECGACGKDDNTLEGHHLVYRARLIDGVVEDLMVLCQSCHRTVHQFMQPHDPRTSVEHRRINTINFIRRQQGGFRTLPFLEAAG